MGQGLGTDQGPEAGRHRRRDHDRLQGRDVRNRLANQKVDEPVDFGDKSFVWDEQAEGRPHPTEPVWYIDRLDGEGIHRWVNCQFIGLYDGRE